MNRNSNLYHVYPSEFQIYPDEAYQNFSSEENTEAVENELTNGVQGNIHYRNFSPQSPPKPLIYRTYNPRSRNASTDLKTSIDGLCKNALSVLHVVSGLGKEQSTPIPDKNRTMADGDFGDDAAFYVETCTKYVLGISDGAGGNRGYGFDPKRFARQLMRHCADYILAKSEDDMYPSLVQTVFTALQICQDRKIYGSGTLCICSFEKSTGRLNTINIGDSGYIVIRNGSVFKSARRSYRNDGSEAPLQLDVYPWSFNQRAKFMLDSGEIGDVEKMLDCVLIKSGDILIMGSDGVFDNLNHQQILKIIQNNVVGLMLTHSSHMIKCLNVAADAIVEASKNSNNAPDDVIVVLAYFK